eukprot:jgi/Mesvir1/7763/Mv11706-RA.1
MSMANAVLKTVAVLVALFIAVSATINIVGGKLASGICSLFGKKGDDKCESRVINVLDAIALPLFAIAAAVGVTTRWKNYRDARALVKAKMALILEETMKKKPAATTPAQTAK